MIIIIKKKWLFQTFWPSSNMLQDTNIWQKFCNIIQDLGPEARVKIWSKITICLCQYTYYLVVNKKF